MRLLMTLALIMSTTACAGTYTVVRHDEAVEFTPTTWAVGAVAVDTGSTASLPGEALDRGLMDGLNEGAGDFRFEPRTSSPSYTIRVRVDNARDEHLRGEEPRSTARAEVEIVDAAQREVARLRMNVVGEGVDAATRAHSAGAAIGRHVTHYIHNHEMHDH